MSRKETIKVRQGKLKEIFLEQLKRTPTVEQSCQKVGVGRATVYRWMKAGKKFGKEVEGALAEGRKFMSDVAETQLFSLIGEKKMDAIRLFLTTHNERYGNKLQLLGTLNTRDEPLTAEQKALIKKARELTKIQYEKEKNNQKEAEQGRGREEGHGENIE